MNLTASGTTNFDFDHDFAPVADGYERGRPLCKLDTTYTSVMSSQASGVIHGNSQGAFTLSRPTLENGSAKMNASANGAVPREVYLAKRSIENPYPLQFSPGEDSARKDSILEECQMQLAARMNSHKATDGSQSSPRAESQAEGKASLLSQKRAHPMSKISEESLLLQGAFCGRSR